MSVPRVGTRSRKEESYNGKAKRAASLQSGSVYLNVDASLILNVLATAVVVVGPGSCVYQVNATTKKLFESSRSYLCDRHLDFLPADSPIFYLPRQALSDGSDVSEHGVTLSDALTGETWVGCDCDQCLKMGQQFTHRHAARSVTAMAAMLAHEIKNPPSGIRGAAQLLELNALPENKLLTQLICKEADRIVALANHMDIFPPPPRTGNREHPSCT